MALGDGEEIPFRTDSGECPRGFPERVHLSRFTPSPLRRGKDGDELKLLRAGEFERDPYGDTKGLGVRNWRFWFTGKLRRRTSGEFSRELKNILKHQQMMVSKFFFHQVHSRAGQI